MDHKKYYIGFDNLFQGYLYILKNKSTGELFIQSSGSWLLWKTPNEALEDTKNVTSHNEQYKHSFESKEAAEYATLDDIKSAGWENYAINL